MHTAKNIFILLLAVVVSAAHYLQLLHTAPDLPLYITGGGHTVLVLSLTLGSIKAADVRDSIAYF